MSFDTTQAWFDLCTAKARYCRYLDSKDWQALADLMTEDFSLDVSGASDLPVIEGREAALAQVRSSIEHAVTAHQVHNPEITFEGDSARVIWAMQDRVLWGPERLSISGFGHYHEHWLLFNGQWKLKSQRLTRLHVDVLPAAGQ
ncbi:nuclear transport factor 2 family protein [Halioxenophilus sp. WMMB6]|uniref:nuclear transport factor 2 family protein n=1 Tax=Halioxenophilus sp. WMMB6 TaxID=3073815 RepID=UPI00295E77FC|nr:nuclear transport factor 2 family protein [Halioxenophilus sp. WMMB6]